MKILVNFNENNEFTHFKKLFHDITGTYLTTL